MYIGNTPFQGLVGGGNILDASIEGVDLSTSAIAARLGYTPVDPGAAVFSANPTISSGVANGIAYLNGSKVVTSGSALTFDGTDFALTSGGLLDIDGTSGSTAFRIRQTTAGAGTEFKATITENTGIIFDCTDGGSTARSFIWTQVGSEAMRLTSTGLGIGLGGSNPSAKLHVKGTEYAQIIETASTTDNDAIRLALIAPGAQSQVELEWWNDSTKTGGGYGLIQTGKSANSPSFNFMVGKLGIGTISPANKLEVYQSDAGLGAAKILHVNGNYVNVQPSYNYYAAYNHIFQSLNGTGEYGRFDNSGRLLVGTTSNFGGAGQFAIDQQGGGIPSVHLIGTQGVGGGQREVSLVLSGITNDTGTAYGNLGKIAAAKENAIQGNTAGYMGFSTTPNGGVLTERVRINSAGNVLINSTTNQGQTLKVGDAGTSLNSIIGMSSSSAGYCALWFGDSDSNVGYILYDHTNNYMAFRANGGAESMRINSAGNLGIGQTLPTAKLHIGSETDPNITNQALFVQGSKTGYAGYNGLPMGGLFIYDDTASTAGSGGAIGFGANTGSSQRTWIASINSERDSATNDASNYAGSLVFYTRPAQATPEERLRITSSGSLLFGNTNTIAIIRRKTANGSNGIKIQANAADTVNDSNAGASIQIGGGALGDTYEGNIDLVAYGSIVDSNRNQIRFSNRSGTNATQERMRIDHNGRVLIGTTGISANASNGTIAWINGGLIVSDKKFATNSGSFYSTTSSGTRNITISGLNNTGEYYAKVTLVGLCGYAGGGYFTRIVEFTGYGAEGRVTTISNTATGGDLPPTVVVTAPNTSTVNIAVTFAGNYRCVAYLETYSGTAMYISGVSGTNA